MPRPPRAFKAARLSLEVSDSDKARLERLQTTMDARSTTEVISRALATYETLLKLSEKGVIHIVKPDGKEVLVLTEI